MPCLTLFLFYMPFLSSFGGAASIGFGLSRTPAEGGDGPYTGTLYYYEGADETDTTSTWATIGKWYKNSSHTQAASALPSADNATVLLNNTSVDLETWTAPESIDISGKSLTLSAHALGSGCASAKEFSTTITADSSSNLILDGHILITGVNHELYTYDYITDTYYYFDAPLEINDYIYENQYSDVVAAVALTFDIQEDGDFYNITTNNTGKVITKELFSLNPTGPNRDIEHELYMGRITGFSKYRGFSTKWVVADCAEAATSGAAGIGENGVGFKLFTPPHITITSKEPVYLVATRDMDSGEITYLEEPTPYGGTFAYYYGMEASEELFKEVTTDQFGYITETVFCA